MFTDIRHLPESVSSEELVLFDSNVLEPRTYKSVSNNMYENSVKYKLLEAMDDGRIKYPVFLENFSNYVTALYHMKEHKRAEDFAEWLSDFDKDKQHIYYMVKPAFGRIEDYYRDIELSVEKELLREDLGKNSILLSSAAVYYGIPIIVSASGKLRESQDKVRKIYNGMYPDSETKFSVYGMKEFCVKENLLDEVTNEYFKIAEGTQVQPSLRKFGKRPKSPGKIRQEGPGKHARGKMRASFLR